MTLTLSADLQRDLAALTSRSGPAVSTLWRHAERLDDLRRWTRAALARSHLVVVARALHRALDATSVDLETLGIPVDVLDVTLLGRFGRKRKPRALIADPALGLELLPAVLQTRRLFSGHFLPGRRVRELVAAEYDAFARQRHPVLLGYCEQLEAQGYEVVGLPDLRIDPTENLFRTHNLDLLYANVLPRLRKGGPRCTTCPGRSLRWTAPPSSSTAAPASRPCACRDHPEQPTR